MNIARTIGWLIAAGAAALALGAAAQTPPAAKQAPAKPARAKPASARPAAAGPKVERSRPVSPRARAAGTATSVPVVAAATTPAPLRTAPPPVGKTVSQRKEETLKAAREHQLVPAGEGSTRP